MHTHWSQRFVPNNDVNPTSEDVKLHIIITGHWLLRHMLNAYLQAAGYSRIIFYFTDSADKL